MTIEYAPVSGEGRLWTEQSGDGAPVVLLHGSVHDSRLWDGVFPDLALHRTAIRYDARGLGRSTLPTAPFRYEDDLLAVLDHFDVERAALVGLSMGGEVALDFTLEHPERVRSLTLVAASAGGHDWPRSPELDAYAAADRGSDPDRLAELELAVWAPLGDRAPGVPGDRDHGHRERQGASGRREGSRPVRRGRCRRAPRPGRGADHRRRRRSQPPGDRRDRPPTRRGHPRRTPGGGGQG
ncbi:MAG: alpha/beta fold hydrolase [Umezawaea sp.]